MVPGRADIVAPDDGRLLSMAAIWYYERFRLHLSFVALTAAAADPDADDIEKELQSPG